MDREVGAATLLDEVTFGSARGGAKRAEPWTLAVVRELTAADLMALSTAEALGSKPVDPAKLRASHHQLARLLASGSSPGEASLLSGYAPSTISNLQLSPAFQELMAYYAVQEEQKWSDWVERMRVLGLSALDELLLRLELEPEKFSRRELMELAETMLIKGQQGAAAAKGSVAAGAVSVSVTFVQSERRGETGSQVIEGEIVR